MTRLSRSRSVAMLDPAPVECAHRVVARRRDQAAADRRRPALRHDGVAPSPVVVRVEFVKVATPSPL